jgi:tetratricopeptide (TPR) repeat protein
MYSKLSRKFVIGVCLVSIVISTACLWDYDTIQMERQRFPEINELIVGKFLRHSPEFYQWRIKDREARLNQSPDSLALYDDLAVAYSKLENNKKAIEIILKKEKLKSGLYEAYANLGTFYIHDGQLEKGLEYINKAIAINPNAHFGREIFQKHLVEYILMKKKNNDGKLPLPLSNHIVSNLETVEILDETMSAKRNINRQNFEDFLRKQFKYDKKHKTQALELYNTVYKAKALKGITGMMKFGNYDSPILLEALGDLLLINYEASNQLAARAYMQAYNKTKQPIYRTKAEEALAGQKELTKERFEHEFAQEVEDGKMFYEQIRQDEINWIRNGINPEMAFAQKYYQNPKISTEAKAESKKDQNLNRKKTTIETARSTTGLGIGTLFSVVGVMLLAFWGYIRYSRNS